MKLSHTNSIAYCFVNVPLMLCITEIFVAFVFSVHVFIPVQSLNAQNANNTPVFVCFQNVDLLTFVMHLTLDIFNPKKNPVILEFCVCMLLYYICEFVRIQECFCKVVSSANSPNELK